MTVSFIWTDLSHSYAHVNSKKTIPMYHCKWANINYVMEIFFLNDNVTQIFNKRSQLLKLFEDISMKIDAFDNLEHPVWHKELRVIYL